MNPALYLCCLLPIFVVLYYQWQQKKVFIKQHIIGKKHKKENPAMPESLKPYIGKECLIYTMNSQLAGTVKAVEGGWVSVDNGKTIEAVNLDYIVRIREYPTGRSGKKKALVLD